MKRRTFLFSLIALPFVPTILTSFAGATDNEDELKNYVSNHLTFLLESFRFELADEMTADHMRKHINAFGDHLVRDKSVEKYDVMIDLYPNEYEIVVKFSYRKTKDYVIVVHMRKS